MRSLSFSERSTQIHIDAPKKENTNIDGPELPDFLDVIHNKQSTTIHFSEDKLMFISSLVSKETTTPCGNGEKNSMKEISVNSLNY